VSGEAGPAAADAVAPADSLGAAVFSAILFLVFAAVFVDAGSFSPDASLFPRLIAVLAMMSAAVAFVRSLRGAVAGRHAAAVRTRAAICWRDLLISYAGPPLYCGLITLAGFWIASVIFLAGLLFVLGTRRVRLVVLLTAGTLALIYVAFELVFGIPLPGGMIFEAAGS
jgi:hypothetical protein